MCVAGGGHPGPVKPRGGWQEAVSLCYHAKLTAPELVKDTVLLGGQEKHTYFNLHHRMMASCPLCVCVCLSLS